MFQESIVAKKLQLKVYESVPIGVVYFWHVRLFGCLLTDGAF